MTPFVPIEVGDVWVSRGTARHAYGMTVLVTGLTPWSVVYRPLDPHGRQHRQERTIRRERFLARYAPRPSGHPRRAGRKT